MKPSVWITSASFILFLLAPLFATGGEKKLTQDEEFFKTAASAGFAEVKTSQYAEKNGNNEKVRDLAAHLVKEHTDLNKKLTENAKGLKVAVVVGFEKDRKAKYDRLTKLEGAAFDRAYLKQLIEGHKESIKLFETQAREGKHEELRTFANDTLPQLRKHLKKAQETAEAVNQ